MDLAWKMDPVPQYLYPVDSSPQWVELFPCSDPNNHLQQRVDTAACTRVNVI